MLDKQKLIYAGKICPYCDKSTEYIDSSVVYKGVSYGMIYLCRPCRAWVGVHRKISQKSLGRLAKRELRVLKKQAHIFLDFLCKNKMKKTGIKKGEARDLAYNQLSKVMKIEPEYTHIGMFNEEQCKIVIELYRPYFNKLTNKKSCKSKNNEKEVEQKR